MIRRFYATKDNTITNAFEENLTTRGTGSNMGASDILEVFSIRGQATSGSSELSRVLIQFDTDEIATSRTNGNIPASGSVNFYLKMYNAPHSRTTPRDYKICVYAVSSSWEEGYGLDMEGYSDLTDDEVGSNWVNANNTFSAATTTIAVADGDAASGMTEKEYITIMSTDRTSKTYAIVDGDKTSVSTGTVLASDSDTGTSTAGASLIGAIAVNIDLTGTPDTQNTFLVQLKAAIENSNGHGSKITVSSVPGAADGAQSITLTQASNGFGGNTAVTTDISQLTTPTFTGGSGQWAIPGGLPRTGSISEETFVTGHENLEVDVTPIVEHWLASAGSGENNWSNYGFHIRLSSSYEAQFSGSQSQQDAGYSGSVPVNQSGSTRSYYTKKFFGRNSEFHFKKPVLEARYDDTKQDDRGNFYFSSSLAETAENMNTIYLYNYIRGRLRDIPGFGSGESSLYVKIFSGSNTTPTGTYLNQKRDNGSGTNRLWGAATASWASTGIYSCGISITGSSVGSSLTNAAVTYPLTKIYDVWYDSNGNQYFTGSITPKDFASQGFRTSKKYVLSMPNLQEQYYKGETALMRLYIREKNWSPNIYNVANANAIPSTLIESASFQLKRSVDSEVIVPYGTGSLKHTGLSYDVTGNYFKLDTSYLESGYQYELSYTFFTEDSNSYVEQPYRFKFRVVDDEY